MKIIVSHQGKQHLNALLLGLEKFNVLTRFYTGFAFQKIKTPQYLPEKWSKKLQKRHFINIPVDKIIHFPFIFFMTKWIKTEIGHVKMPYKWFDSWVAKRLKKDYYDILIGYENHNLLSFKEAKRAGKITVLDLAGVHHDFQTPVLMAVGAYSEDTQIEYISERKEQALEYTDYMLVVSKFAEKTVVDAGFPADRVYIKYHGFNQAVFKPKPTYNTEGALNIYFVGTMGRRKGIPFLIDVFKGLIKKGLDIRLTLIGPIDDFEVAHLDLPNYTYLPFLTHQELLKIHHELDLFVFPTNIDSWAQVVVEAMACGSPVLVSENTGAKDAVEQGGGMILPICDEKAWSDAIEKFYFDRTLLKKLGEESVAVAAQYTVVGYHQQVFNIMADIYQREKYKTDRNYKVLKTA